MKKSKFLKNSKDLLSRGFNPSKCKTALKLAGSRVKLLRNKKEVQVKQIQREIAQLLGSGQVQTARIRVEHVVREEKMMAAYELIEIYCELIVSRLQIIETQKICPMDLKEAITSLIFASPRCGDVPELGDVKKHFTDKYGKDFATAAVELRPQSGVSRLMVEKLSATAPDGPTKIKILSAIADEHNVKWDPESFQEKESLPPTPTELLKGPTTFEETKIHGEPSRAESLDDRARQNNHRMNHSVSNLSQPDYRSSWGEERHTSPETSVDNTEFHGEATTSERAHLFPGDGNTTPRNRQRWNMQFKDATAAAQAAAESAELASMAARAAAELSSRDKFMRQYSTESHKSESDASEHRGPETFVNSTFEREQVFEEQRNRSFSGNTGLWNEQIDGMQPNNQRTVGRFNENSHSGKKEFSQSASLTSKASLRDNSLDHDIPAVYGYSRKNSLQDTSRDEMNVQRQSFKYEHARAGIHDNVREDRIEKQPSVAYSRSHSNISDDVNIFADHEDQFKSDAGEDSFMSSGKVGAYGQSSQTRYHEAAAVSDKSDSEGGILDFSTGPKYDDYEPEFHLSSSSQKPHEHLSVNPDSWSGRSSSGRRKSNSSRFSTGNNFSDFSENLKPADGSKMNDPVSVTYDESDGSASENDINTNFSGHTSIEDSRDLPSKYDQSVRQDKGQSKFDRKQFSFSPDNELASDAGPTAKSYLGKSSFNQPVLSPRNSQMEFDDFEDSSLNAGMGLNYPKPRGGLRHKGYNPLPSLEKRNDTPSSFSKKPEVAAATTTRPTVSTSSESPSISTMYGHKRSEIIQDSHSVSDSEHHSGEEDPIRKKSDQNLRQNVNRAIKDVNIKPTFGASKSFLGSDNSDSDEDAPKESLTRKSHKQNGISQRTMGSFSGSGKTSYSKMHLSSEAHDFNDEMDKKSRTTSETPKTYKSWRSSSQMDNDEQPTSSKAASRTVQSNFRGPPEPYSSGKAASSITQESKVQLRSEGRDSDAKVGRIPTNSYTPETRQQYPSLRKNFSKLGNSEQTISSKAAPKPHNENLLQTHDEHSPSKPNSEAMKESNKTWNSFTRKESSQAPKETGSYISSETVKPAATLSKTSSNNQRASHVHPKLPDYDTLVETLRKNRI